MRKLFNGVNILAIVYFVIYGLYRFWESYLNFSKVDFPHEPSFLGIFLLFFGINILDSLMRGDKWILSLYTILMLISIGMGGYQMVDNFEVLLDERANTMDYVDTETLLGHLENSREGVKQPMLFYFEKDGIDKMERYHHLLEKFAEEHSLKVYCYNFTYHSKEDNTRVEKAFKIEQLPTLWAFYGEQRRSCQGLQIPAFLYDERATIKSHTPVLRFSKSNK